MRLANNCLCNMRANLHNLKRLNGLPLKNKVLYITNALAGEILRTRSIGTFGLRLVEISLTNRCQCRCDHCYAAQEHKQSTQDELSKHEVFKLIDDIVDTGGTEIIFTGGEPLLRGDLLELVAYARSKRLVVRIITNGILLKESLIKKLKTSGLSWCSVSLDSPYAHEHDKFRKYEGCFHKAIHGIQLLVSNKIPCSIITVARKELIHSGDIEKIVQFGIINKVDLVRINFPVPIGNYKYFDNNILTISERNDVRKLLSYGIVSMESPKENTKCTAAITKLHVMTNGDVTPCVFVPLPYGNIRKDNFFNIWKNMEKYIKEYQMNGQCPMCDPNLRKKINDAIQNKQ